MSDRIDTLVARPPATPDITKLRPTLFVALGGTGKEIALRLRRRILLHDWGSSRRLRTLADFPIASFIYFDTDTTEALETDRKAGGDPVSRAVGFRDFEKLQHAVDVGHYMRELDSHPHVREWLPEGDLANIATEHGAGQVRSISRLLFFDQYDRFQNLVRSQGHAVLNNIGRARQLQELSLDIEHKLRVVVIASTAGGTGSGSFIDAGLTIRSITDPEPDQVDLILLLPGGYRQNNARRVNANSFAALMELEHVMRPGATPPYVERWTADGQKPRKGSPYKDVYLIDTTNVSRDQTSEITHIYDMVADVLFEDFGNSEFASRKRSVSANSGQFKLVNYFPPLPERFGQKSLSYSCAYSSFGQATIVTKSAAALEAASVNASKAMIQSFFNVAVQDTGRLPTPDERAAFAERMYFLRPSTFDETLEGIDDTNTINEPELIGELLKQDTGDTVETRLTDQIHKRFEEIRASADLRNWPIQAQRVFDESRDDVIGSIDNAAHTHGPSGATITANRRRLLSWLRSDEADAVRTSLFNYLENRARGGLDYVLKLVEQTKHTLENEKRIILAAQGKYEARAEKVRERFNLSLDNLRDASRKRMLLPPDRKSADKFLEHLRGETAYYVKLRLRAIACEEAIQFVESASQDLGTRRGLDAEGREIWDGVVSEFVQGKRQVEAILKELDDEVELLNDAVTRQNAGTYIVLPDADAEADSLLVLSQTEVDSWAAEIFKGEGGSRTLFPKLENPTNKAELLTRLRSFARQQLTPRERHLRSVREILQDIDPEQRREILRGAMRRAMPWVNARFDRLGSLPMQSRYKLYVAVENDANLNTTLANEIRNAIPTPPGFQHCEIVSSGQRDRLVIYCELSGFPLDALVPLGDTWRRDYRLERREPLPLHNHRSAVRFTNPVVPTTEEIEETRALMSLFIRAVAFGILRRTSGPDAPYVLDLGQGDWDKVGTERDIRAEGLLPSHRQEIVTAVDRFERKLAPIQVLAAAALLEWTAQRVYASRRVQVDETRSERQPSMIQVVARDQAKTYRTRFEQMEGASAFQSREDLENALKASIPSWTIEIPGSMEDLDAFEVNKNPDDPPLLRATDKRTIVPDRFTPERLLEIVRPIQEPVAKPAPVPRMPATALPPASTSSSWLLSIKKTLHGPYTLAELRTLAANGTLLEGTNVKAAGSAVWTKVRDLPILAELLRQEDLPDDEEETLPDDE